MANFTTYSTGTEAAITSPAGVYFNFFRYKMNEIVSINPEAFTGVELLEGEEGAVGSVKRWNYILDGDAKTASVKIEAIDEGAKSTTFAAVDGDLLVDYKSFKATLTVSEGSAQWIFAYQNATMLSPPPMPYIQLAFTLSNRVDDFLLHNRETSFELLQPKLS